MTSRHDLLSSRIPNASLLLGPAFNPLSPNIRIQILQTDLHTFP